jgi:hypothetical protein
MKKPTKAEIKRLKKLCEKEIVQWIAVLSQLEELEAKMK